MFVTLICKSLVINELRLRNLASGTTFDDFLRPCVRYTISLLTPPGEAAITNLS